VGIAAAREAAVRTPAASAVATRLPPVDKLAALPPTRTQPAGSAAAVAAPTATAQPPEATEGDIVWLCTLAAALAARAALAREQQQQQ
jgi:hypothetical protein